MIDRPMHGWALAELGAGMLVCLFDTNVPQYCARTGESTLIPCQIATPLSRCPPPKHWPRRRSRWGGGAGRGAGCTKGERERPKEKGHRKESARFVGFGSLLFLFLSVCCRPVCLSVWSLASVCVRCYVCLCARARLLPWRGVSVLSASPLKSSCVLPSSIRVRREGGGAPRMFCLGNGPSFLVVAPCSPPPLAFLNFVLHSPFLFTFQVPIHWRSLVLIPSFPALTHTHYSCD